MKLFDSIAELFEPSRAVSPQVREAIEVAGQLVGPMLRAAPGYPKRLSGPASQALAYCGELARTIPGPLDVNRNAFASDPLVHAMFGSSDGISEMLGRSHVLREFLRGNAAPTTFYALLGTRRKEKRQFGMALEGNALIKDVPQTTLYFSDHTLTDPATQLDEAREKLQASMLRGLVEGYALHVRELLDQRDRTTLDLAMQRASASRHGTSRTEIAHAAQTRRVQELDAALRAHAEDLSPRRLMDELAACFCKPQPLLHLDPVEVAVDQIGIVAESAAARDRADTLRFVELTSRDRRQWVVVLACIRRDEAMAAIREVERATRYIVI